MMIDVTVSALYVGDEVVLILCGKESTTELEKQVEIDKVHEQLMHILGEKHGVEFIPFPHEEKKEEKKEIDYPELKEMPTF